MHGGVFILVFSYQKADLDRAHRHLLSTEALKGERFVNFVLSVALLALHLKLRVSVIQLTIHYRKFGNSSWLR